MRPEQVVQAAIDAKGAVLMAGGDAVRTRYAKSIADNPNIHYEIPN